MTINSTLVYDTLLRAFAEAKADIESVAPSGVKVNLWIYLYNEPKPKFKLKVELGYSTKLAEVEGIDLAAMVAEAKRRMGWQEQQNALQLAPPATSEVGSEAEAEDNPHKTQPPVVEAETSDEIPY